MNIQNLARSQPRSDEMGKHSGVLELADAERSIVTALLRTPVAQEALAAAESEHVDKRRVLAEKLHSARFEHALAVRTASDELHAKRESANPVRLAYQQALFEVQLAQQALTHRESARNVQLSRMEHELRSGSDARLAPFVGKLRWLGSEVRNRGVRTVVFSKRGNRSNADQVLQTYLRIEELSTDVEAMQLEPLSRAQVTERLQTIVTELDPRLQSLHNFSTEELQKIVQRASA